MLPPVEKEAGTLFLFIFALARASTPLGHRSDSPRSVELGDFLPADDAVVHHFRFLRGLYFIGFHWFLLQRQSGNE